MMYYSVMTQANSEKEIPSAPIRSRTQDLPIISSDALPLSCRRLMGAKAIKLGSWDKHPALTARIVKFVINYHPSAIKLSISASDQRQSRLEWIET